MGAGVKSIKKTNFKSKTREKNMLNSIPTELITEIVARVAACSSDDLFNATLSCKTLSKIADDMYIIRHVSLDKLAVIPWTPKEQAILDRCTNSGNPEAVYRCGIIHYFGKRDLTSGFEYLRRAAKLGHLGALYVIGIILILDGGEGKEKGMKIIGDMKFKKTRKEIKEIREKFSSIFYKYIWVKNTTGVEHIRPTCCTRHEQAQIVGWNTNEDIDDDSECEECSCDQEIIHLWEVLPSYI